jgi:hypothetical protein
MPRSQKKLNSLLWSWSKKLLESLMGGDFLSSQLERKNQYRENRILDLIYHWRFSEIEIEIFCLFHLKY